MAKAPLPKALPGTMFVLEWDRDRLTFILHTDDPGYSSYNLGSDIPRVSLQFKLWDHEDLGNNAIDMAHEFGAARVSLQTGRVVAVFDREGEQKKVNFKEERGNARPLPTLRSNS